MKLKKRTVKTLIRSTVLYAEWIWTLRRQVYCGDNDHLKQSLILFGQFDTMATVSEYSMPHDIWLYCVELSLFFRGLFRLAQASNVPLARICVTRGSCGRVYFVLEYLVYGHFGPKTVRHWCRSVLGPKCPYMYFGRRCALCVIRPFDILPSTTYRFLYWEHTL